MLSGVLIGILATFFGLAVGSFTCVVIDRLPLALDEPNEYGDLWDTRPWNEVLGGRSRCSSCGTPVKNIENIPVFAWLVLRGKCRTCGASIGAFHLLVEAGVPILGWVVFAQLGAHWTTLPVLLLIPVGLAVMVIDARTLIVPTRVIWPSFFVSVALCVGVALGLGHARWLIGGLIGIATLAGPLALLWFAMPKAMGFGDVRLTTLLGWTVGFMGAMATDRPVLLAILSLIVMILASVGGIILGVVTKVGFGRQMPFGPSLVLAALAVSTYTDWFLSPFR